VNEGIRRPWRPSGRTFVHFVPALNVEDYIEKHSVAAPGMRMRLRVDRQILLFLAAERTLSRAIAQGSIARDR